MVELELSGPHKCRKTGSLRNAAASTQTVVKWYWCLRTVEKPEVAEVYKPLDAWPADPAQPHG